MCAQRPDMASAPRAWLAAAAVLVVGWLAITYSSIRLYPSPWQDEVVWSAAATHFLRAGNFGVDIWPDRYGLRENYFNIGRLFVLYLAGVFRAFGAGWLQARWAVAVAALASAVMLGFAMRRLYSPGHGVAAAALYLFSWNAFFYSHYVRPEMFGLAASLGLTCWFVARRDTDSRLAWFGWGAANAVLLDTHFSYLHLFIALDLLFIVEAARRRAWKCVAWLGMGHVVGGAYWLIAHFAPDPMAVLRQIEFISNPIMGAGGARLAAADRWRVAWDQFAAQFITFTRLSLLQFAAILLAAAIAARQRRRHWRILLPATSLLLTLFVLLPAPHYYLLFLMPWLSALMIIAADEWLAHWRAASTLRWLQWTYPFVLCVLFVAYLGGDLLLAWNNRGLEYETMGRAITRLAPPTAQVIGDAVWFYFYPDGNFTQPIFLNLKSDAEMRAALDSLIAERQADYILLNETVPDPNMLPGHPAYVAERCENVGVVTGSLYGVDLGMGYSAARVAVYKCASSAAPHPWRYRPW